MLLNCLHVHYQLWEYALHFVLSIIWCTLYNVWSYVPMYVTRPAYFLFKGQPTLTYNSSHIVFHYFLVYLVIFHHQSVLFVFFSFFSFLLHLLYNLVSFELHDGRLSSLRDWCEMTSHILLLAPYIEKDRGRYQHAMLMLYIILFSKFQNVSRGNP